jgi:hypothetical protein
MEIPSARTLPGKAMTAAAKNAKHIEIKELFFMLNLFFIYRVFLFITKESKKGTKHEKGMIFVAWRSILYEEFASRGKRRSS